MSQQSAVKIQIQQKTVDSKQCGLNPYSIDYFCVCAQVHTHTCNTHGLCMHNHTIQLAKLKV